MSDQTNHTEHRDVRVEINRTEYPSPTPTSGEALYRLGDIPAHQELFRESGGLEEDELVPRDAAVVHLHNGEHFYSEKVFKIFVNTREREVPGPTVSYDEIVKLAYPTKPAGQTGDEYLVLYNKGPRRNPEGTLLESHSVQVKNGMIFHVTPADKS